MTPIDRIPSPLHLLVTQKETSEWHKWPRMRYDRRTWTELDVFTLTFEITLSPDFAPGNSPFYAKAGNEIKATIS